MAKSRRKPKTPPPPAVVLMVDDVALSLNTLQSAEYRAIEEVRLAAVATRGKADHLAKDLKKAVIVDADAVQASKAANAEAKRLASEARARELALVADLIGTAEERQINEHLAKVEAEEILRGGSVVRNAAGNLEVRGRDGLAMLFNVGLDAKAKAKKARANGKCSSETAGITAAMFMAGSEYRRLYEACHSGIGSQLRPRVGGGRGPADTDRSYLERTRIHVEAVVKVSADAADVDRELAVHMLREVAGEGRCIAELYPNKGQPAQRAKAALRVALVAVGVVRRIPGA